MIKELNIKAFEFVEKIKLFDKVENSSRKKGSINHLPTTTLSGQIIDSPIIERTYNPDYSNFKIIINTKEGRLGFDSNIYPDFYFFISQLSNSDEFYFKVSNKFLEENVLNWMINVYQNKKAENALSDYLFDVIEKSIVDSIVV